MTKNSPEALQQLVEKILTDLEKNENCAGWECYECPLHLKEAVEDSWGDVTQCGWVLLKSATSMILRK